MRAVMRARLLPAAMVVAALPALAAACHPAPDRPPVPPVLPRPTNPANTPALAFDPAEALEDASIHSDAGPALDAAILDLDTGASGRQP
jgi:malic enzyme